MIDWNKAQPWRQRANLDWSTIDLDKLAKLPEYKLPPTYRLSDHLGSACHLDAPGYPSYFVQHVYTQYGNNPPRGAEAVIVGPDGVLRVVQWARGAGSGYGARDGILASLYKPLPWDHARVQAWVRHVYQHMAHCYTTDPVSRDMVVWPVPSYERNRAALDYKHAALMLARSGQGPAPTIMGMVRAVRALIAQRRKVVTYRNHRAFLHTRKFYPDAGAILHYIVTPPTVAANENWWETSNNPDLRWNP